MSKRKRKPESGGNAAGEARPPDGGKSNTVAAAAAKGASGIFTGRKLAFTCAGLFLLVFLVFSPALKNDFVHYDDADYVVDNPHVKAGLTLPGIKWAFTTGRSSNWHPLTWISHMLDCQFFGLKPWGHHLTNVLLHALNAVLLFLALRKMTGADWKSLLVALLFGLHPLRVESVAWVAERKDVLSTFFWMLSLLVYTRYAQESRLPGLKAVRWYVFTLLLFVCGLMSKPMVVTLPCVLLLLDWWPLRRIFDREAGGSRRSGSVSLRRAVLEKVPFFALAALSSVITVRVQQEAMSENVPLLLRSENAVVAYCRYVGKLLWPENLAIIYPHPGYWPAAVLVVCGLVLIMLSAVAFALRRSQPWFAVGWCWFIGTLVPAIGIVQVGGQSMADRYSYVPCVGMFIMMVWGGQELARRWPPARACFVATAAAVLVGFAGLTVRQISYWKEGETLFRHATQVTSDNAAAWVHLGVAAGRNGKGAEAIADFREALRIQPRNLEALGHLGAELVDAKQINEALPMLQRVSELEKDSPAAHNNFGQALSDAGRYDEAILQFQEALRLRPDYPMAQHNWGLALVGKHDLDGAIPHFLKAVEMDPFHFDAHKSLGIIYYYKGRYDDAIEQNLLALKIRPNDPGVLQNLEVVREDKAAAQKSGRLPGAKP